MPETDWERTKRILAARGLADESGTTRKARMRRCKCRAAVLAGLDGEWLARTAVVDPEPLDAVQVVLALAEGRRIWKVNRFGGVVYLDWISWHLESLDGKTLVREHRCEGK